MWPLAALTEFSYKKIYGRFAGTKKSGHNNEVARDSTVSRKSSLSVSYLVGDYFQNRFIYSD